MDRQREASQHQQQLGAAAMKLRACKAQNEQLQRRLQEGAPRRQAGGAAGMFRPAQAGVGGVFGAAGGAFA